MEIWGRGGMGAWDTPRDCSRLRVLLPRSTAPPLREISAQRCFFAGVSPPKHTKKCQRVFVLFLVAWVILLYLLSFSLFLFWSRFCACRCCLHLFNFLLGHAVLYAQSKHPHAPTRTLAALGERLRARAHVQFGRKGITGKRAHRGARACGWAGLRVCAFNFSTCRHDRTEGLARTTRTGRAK